MENNKLFNKFLEVMNRFAQIKTYTIPITMTQMYQIGRAHV